MQEIEINTFSKFREWLAENKNQNKHLAFRGQADSEWELRTSLARCFLQYRINPAEWRARELKMYYEFRELLIRACPGMYEHWQPVDVLSLMQHHGAPTRLIDFSYSPCVAAHFALSDSRGDSAIWVVDKKTLDNRRLTMKLDEYCGPTHLPDYDVFHKKGNYQLVASITEPKHLNGRLSAQSGCFFVPGSI